MDVSEQSFETPVKSQPEPDRQNGQKVVPFPEMATSVAPLERDHSWKALDILAHAANPPAPPEIGGLAYPGMRHVFSGEAETGKSWLLLFLAAEEIVSGRGQYGSTRIRWGRVRSLSACNS